MIGSNRFSTLESLIRVKNKTTDDTWFLRFYQNSQRKSCLSQAEDRHGAASFRVSEMPRQLFWHFAQKINVNSGFRSPETVGEALAHYIEHELTEESGKRSSTREVYGGFLKVQIEPTWGSYRLDQIKTIDGRAVVAFSSSCPCYEMPRSGT